MINYLRFPKPSTCPFNVSEALIANTNTSNVMTTRKQTGPTSAQITLSYIDNQQLKCEYIILMQS